jgi:hypothetical protein
VCGLPDPKGTGTAMRDVVISLFDHSGIMVKPWVEAGYKAYIYDLHHEDWQRQGVYKIREDLSECPALPVPSDRIAFVSAFPPCDHLAISGSRWFKGKGLRKLSQSIELFATATEFCEMAGAPYMIENPVSTISTYWRGADYAFHPFWFNRYFPQDNYTKKTCLWVGNGFKMPPMDMVATWGDPDNRIHMTPDSLARARVKNKTPEGFAQAVFWQNGVHLGQALTSSS